MDKANQNFIAMLYDYAINSEWFKNKDTVKHQRRGEESLQHLGLYILIITAFTNDCER